MGNPTELRTQLRARLLAARKGVGPEQRLAADGKIALHVATLLRSRFRAAAVIGVYWPIRDEPDLSVAWNDWGALALPSVVAPGQALRFLSYRPGQALQTKQFGICEPFDRTEVLPDLLIVPCVGFWTAPDGRAYRLGYGQGYYDRTLALRPIPSIGVGYELSRLDQFEPAPHDRALDCVVTECGASG